MDPTNKELYDLVLQDAPYVIAAYGVLWASLVVYVSMVLRRIMRLEKEVEVVETSIERRTSEDA
jgi:CcmD family protein